MKDFRKTRPDHYRINYYPPDIKAIDQQSAAPLEKPYERPARPGTNARTKRRTGSKNRYRILPLLISGYLVFFITILIGILIWSIPAFFSKQDIASATVLPLFIFLLAIFFAAYLVSYIIKARSFFPAFFLTSTIIFIVYFYIGPDNISLTGMILKAVYSIFSAYLAYLIVKLLTKNHRRI